MSIHQECGLVLLLLAACSGGEPARDSGARAAPAVAAPSGGADQAMAAIRAADLDSQATMEALRVARFTEAGTRAARDFLASGGEGDPLWAATWLYASAASDTVPLVPLLESRDASVRVMAAAALAALEHPGGVAALRAERENQAPLRGSEPPITVAAFAELSLERYAGR
jgi:hypothetical protein